MNRGTFARTALASLALLTPSLRAGPLNPPPGPVTSTHKTLTEVEPRIAINSTNTPGDADSLYKITQSGSYYLTGNIAGEVGRHGIEIAASGVTIDLNGFELEGVSRMGAFDGITASVGNLTSITIRNGSIRFWGDKGIDFSAFNASNCIISNVRSIGNADTGIATGPGSLIRDCIANGNSNNGITSGEGGVISECAARGNAEIGISTATGCTIKNCTAYANPNVGILTSTVCTVSECTAQLNGGGILCGAGSTVTSCTSFDNESVGISTGSGCTITGCTARVNTLDGIAFVSNCIVANNTCSSNGSGGDGAGLRASGGNNRIEGNNCTGADRGIDIDSTDNLIIRNTCSANTVNWDIVAGNHYGPIIDRTAASPAPVNGNAATEALGSTHPNANFTF